MDELFAQFERDIADTPTQSVPASRKRNAEEITTPPVKRAAVSIASRPSLAVAAANATASDTPQAPSATSGPFGLADHYGGLDAYQESDVVLPKIKALRARAQVFRAQEMDRKLARNRAQLAVENGQASAAQWSRDMAKSQGTVNKRAMRTAAGNRWVDPSLTEWPEKDFRMFLGDLAPDATDDLLVKTFEKYPTFCKAHVVTDKRTGKSRGYGFVSFLDEDDYAKAFREMNGKYLGSRPVKIRKCRWQDRMA